LAIPVDAVWRIPGRPAVLAGFRPVKEDEMKYLSRSAVVLVFAVALFSALPAHAAPPPARRAHTAPASLSVAAQLSAAWTRLTHFFAAVTVSPPQGTTIDGGSCIDPNGLGQVLIGQ
jgi:hypothetical protein